jgi:hypothetical protein
MHAKSVAWALCLLPALTGCGTVHNLTTEACLAHTQRALERDLRQDAHVAWQCVRDQHPRRAFTDEFREGFLDGFVDYLDRGGAAAPPAVPPVKYVKKKHYFTPEGHCLINDYYLGFKYGVDVAVASGKRQYLTVPVLVADGSCPPEASPMPGPGAPEIPFIPVPWQPGPAQPYPLPTPQPVPDGGKFGEPKKKGSDDPPETPKLPASPFAPRAGDLRRPVPPLPKPELPVIKPYNPQWPGDKFAPLPVPANPDLLPPPDPPVPESPLVPLPVPPTPPSTTLVIPSGLKVPAPPDAVPTLPPNVPTPSILDDIPAAPFRHATPAPLPFRHPQPGK